MSGQPARTDIELRIVESMVDQAHALGVGFAEAAKAEPDLDRMLALDAAFHRGFLAVRMGIRLCLSLRSGRLSAVVATPRHEPEVLDREDLERERPESLERERAEDPPERERDRDRDYEPVSLSRFLSTLRGVAADAGRLPSHADPAALSALQGLLARVDAPPSAPAPATNVLLRVRPPPPPPQKAHLLGSAVPASSLGVLRRPRPPPRPSG